MTATGEVIQADALARDERSPAQDSEERKVRSRRDSLFARPSFDLALAYVALLFLTAFAPRVFSGRDPAAIDPTNTLAKPSIQHPFGTDQLGRDAFARFVHGGHTTIVAALIALGIAVAGGLTFGVVSGYSTRLVDAVVMRIVDVFLAIPGLLLSLVVITALGFGTVHVAVAVGIGSIPSFARITRAEVLRVRVLPYVEASRGLGSRWGFVLIRRVLPNAAGPVSVLAVLELGSVILAVAALSFLGYGARPPASEWGALISSGSQYLSNAWWLTTLPGLTVALLVYATNHVARSIEEFRKP
jgi:peptide/nickel transport system permease protein